MNPRRQVALHAGPLPAALLSGADLVDPASGALCSFVGTVRNHTRGRAVRELHYDVYPAMAERVLAAVLEEAAAAHDPDLLGRIVHGHGTMQPGDASVAIHIASAHRAAAFAACRHCIERLKADVPIWKHERYVDGESVWVQGS